MSLTFTNNENLQYNNITGAVEDTSSTESQISNASSNIINTTVSDSVISLNSSQMLDNINSIFPIVSLTDPYSDQGLNDTCKMKFGNQYYHLQIYFFNFKQQKYLLHNAAIQELCIEDSLFSWPVKGHIIINNFLEAFERYDKSNKFHYIRNDARDQIEILFFPIPDKNSTGQLPESVWTFKLKCSIYDVEDLISPNIKSKIKKLYFWDKDYQFLLERNIPWSTATETRYRGNNYADKSIDKPLAHCTDYERAMYTGNAIRSLFVAGGFSSEYIDDLNWDMGSSKLFYTTKSNMSVIENIEYLLSKHISDNKDISHKDICILQRDLYSRMLSFKSMYSYFKQAGKEAPGELQREHLFFENFFESEKVTDPFKAPYSDTVSFEIDIKSQIYSKIIGHRFSQMSGLDNAKALISKPVYSHQHNNKQFNVDVYENEIQHVKKYFKNYTDLLYGKNSQPLFLLNKTKKEQINIEPQFSLVSTLNEENDRGIRSLRGRGDILYSGIFMNNALIVDILGSSHRRAGTFVGVDRLKQPSDTIYDYQICGQYLVASVKHIMRQQKYINELTLLKVNSYDNLLDNEEIE